MKSTITLILVLLGIVVMAQTPTIVSGDEQGWYQIGKVTANFKSERESIVVMGKDEFKTIKLRVNDAPIQIDRMQVFFEGGKVQDVDVKQPLKAGEETEEFSLDADNKEIDKVVFYYQSLNDGSGEKASVELYGFKERRDGESSGLREETEEATEEVDEAATDVREELRESRVGVEDDVDHTQDEIRDEAREVRDETNDELRNAEEKIEGASEKAEDHIHKGANNVGDEVDEHATKLESEITDRELEDKVGPDGQEIYIDDNSNHYYVNESGEKVFVSQEDLKDRVR